MTRVLRAFTLALVFTLSLAPAAHAQQAVTKSEAPSAPGPVQVSKLFTTVTDNDYWTTCVSFTNTSTRAIQAVQFGFTYLDAFDEPIANYKADRVGHFAPGVLIEGPDNAGETNDYQKASNCWRTVQVVGSLSSIKVEVLKVRYEDNGEVAVLDPKPSFTAQYLGNHPDMIKCPSIFGIMVGLKWTQLEKTPRGRQCIANWLKANGRANEAGQYLATPSPSPSPTTQP